MKHKTFLVLAVFVFAVAAIGCANRTSGSTTVYDGRSARAVERANCSSADDPRLCECLTVTRIHGGYGSPQERADFCAQVVADERRYMRERQSETTTP